MGSYYTGYKVFLREGGTMFNKVNFRFLIGGCLVRSLARQRQTYSIPADVVKHTFNLKNTPKNHKKLNHPKPWTGGIVPDTDSPDYPKWEEALLETVKSIKNISEKLK